MDVGQTVGTIGGGIAGQTLLGALDGPLPFMDIVGSSIGGAIGGDIGKAIGGKGKKQRMAGGMDPRLLMMNIPMVNPNTQMGGQPEFVNQYGRAYDPLSANLNQKMIPNLAGMGIADPNRHQIPSFLQDYVKY